MNKKALIAGITGQDGAFLAQYLLSKGYEVIGSSRDAKVCNTKNLISLGIKNEVELVSIALNDFRSILQVVTNKKPDEIYNLAGLTSVALSYEQPVECMESIAIANLNFLEVIRYLDRPIRFFNASSSECFGDTKDFVADENTPFNPVSPYAVAKCTSFWQIENYRKYYNLFCVSGILSNHESFLRPNRFVTQKIIRSSLEIKRGEKKSLNLGNIDIWRDWGWAPDYVSAMHLILNAKNPSDYIISTGQTNSLKHFASLAFKASNLNFEDHVNIDKGLYRPSDIKCSRLSPQKIYTELGWKAKYDLEKIVYSMHNHMSKVLN